MSEDEEDNEANKSWGQRHGVSILTAVLFGLMAFVMTIQVAC